MTNEELQLIWGEAFYQECMNEALRVRIQFEPLDPDSISPALVLAVAIQKLRNHLSTFPVKYTHEL